MVYIENGRVVQGQPWGIRRITGFFWGLVFFVINFFKSLIGLDASNNRYGSGSNSRGNGPGGPGGGGRPRGPRTLGRVTTIQDCSMPGGG